MFFVLLLILLVNKFDNMYPSKFYSLGFCDRCCGMYLKCFSRFIILLHYVTLIVIIIMWILIGSGSCDKGWTSTTNFYSDSIRTDMLTCNLITTFVWILLHVGGFFIRGCLFYESFMYDPDPADGARFVTYCFKKCGP